MSIIRDMGRQYFYSKFAGAVVLSPDGKAGCIDTASTYDEDGNVCVISSTGTLGKARRNVIPVPPDYFDSLEKFNVPDLGWRSAAEGRYMAYFQRPQRTYRKGLHVRDLQVTQMAHTTQLINSGNLSGMFFSRDYIVARMLCEPEFMPLADGLAAMNSSDIMGFALSNKLAVGPSDRDDTYILYYEEFPVGTVGSDGTMNLHIPNTFEELT